MAETRMNKRNLERAEKEFKEWEFYLNNIVGVISFDLALSSLGTKSPAFNASISFIFLFSLYIMGKHKFPSIVNYLRKKTDKTEHERLFLSALESKYMGGKSIFARYGAFFVGYLFLVSIIVMSYFSDKYTWIHSYIYGY